jgi:hypothetical protein
MMREADYQPQRYKAVKIITPGRIVAMALTLSPEEVAEALAIPLADVVAALGAKARKHTAVNNRTGETITAYSQRAIYCRAQIKGCTDWDFVEGRA